MANNRLADIIQFYELLESLEKRHSGKRTLSQCSGQQEWPERGVYFFFEAGEQRTTSGVGSRVVRVGAHAVIENSKTTLWNRLSQHRGSVKSGGGNHRGSIFRLLIGDALMSYEPSHSISTWGQGSSASSEIRQAEESLEQIVSRHLGQMQILWLHIVDSPSPQSQRAYIERNAIALLSNWGKIGDQIIDPSSPRWLGRFSSRTTVVNSGLWNQRHVDETYDPAVLDVFAKLMQL